MQLYQMAVNDGGFKVADWFSFSCQWALVARMHGHPCTPTAYHYALSLMQDSLTFAPTVDIQHSRLVAMRNDYETLPLDYASYDVHTGQLHRAVETLERGRALIWSEMRGLRSSIDQLRASDSELADELAAINQNLEVLTLTFGQNNYGDGGEECPEGMDPFGRLVVRQRGLLDDRDKLISQIRTRKGLESFLKPPSFDLLRSAAVRVPSSSSTNVDGVRTSPFSFVTLPPSFPRPTISMTEQTNHPSSYQVRGRKASIQSNMRTLSALYLRNSMTS